MFLPHPRVKVSIVGSLRDREVACSASDRQGSNFESCVWRTVSSQSSHHPQEVLLAQFSLYVHKGGLKPDSFHFICIPVRLSRTSYIWYPTWRRHCVLNKYPQKYNFFFFVFNSTEVETAALEIHIVYSVGWHVLMSQYFVLWFHHWYTTAVISAYLGWWNHMCTKVFSNPPHFILFL